MVGYTSQLYVSNLGSGVDTDQIVFGTLFYSQFFNVYNNTYSAANITSLQASQAASIFVSTNATEAYIGDQVLPIGVNPFPVPPPLPLEFAVSIQADSYMIGLQASI